MPTQSQIRQLQDPSKTTDIYPLTVEEAVFDDAGVQLPTKLTQLYGDIADVEATTTATRAYSVGDYVVCKGQLYKVTASIAIGGTIEEGVNVESVTITDELKSGGGSGAVTGIKGNAESTYRKGNVNLTLANLGYESANNLTTTAAGKLLDARQGKVLNDGLGKAYTDLATVESTSTASKAYAVKEYLVYNGQLYKVTSAIASGGTITPGTNVTEVKITDFVGDCGYSYATARWLRFNPNDKKGLIIKAGTRITLKSGIIKVWATDTPISFSGLSAGTDYFVFVDNSGNVTCSTSATPASNQVKIGRFHTLCVAVGTPTMIAPASPSSGLAVGGKYLVKSYDSGSDSDFYSFYNKTITAVSTGSKYDIITMPHPLSGFTAGDILPESVFCLSFRPECTVEDAMCYDKDTGLAVDVYLQSGTGFNTRSAYNKTHTVNREQGNHQQDYRMVGKRLLRDAEFTSAALGSNEKTAIQGAADKGTVGGHVDTAGRRMVSAIGIEEMCGYLWQWLDDFVGALQDDKWDARDGQNGFGQEYWVPYVLLAGGHWGNSSSCGSRCRSSSNVRSSVYAYIGGRGSSRVNRRI